jgi:microcystin-dependent protein
MFGGNFAPAGWMFCEGQLLPISENETLFQLIGTTYGGDGQSTFGLPDLQGRVPLHQGPNFPRSTRAGVEQVTLSVQQTPSHSHALVASTDTGESPDAEGLVLASTAAVSLYRESTASSALANQAVGPAGGSQPHENFQPYLCIDFIISLFGIFPSQT